MLKVQLVVSKSSTEAQIRRIAENAARITLEVAGPSNPSARVLTPEALAMLVAGPLAAAIFNALLIINTPEDVIK